MSMLPMLLEAGGGEQLDIISLILNASPVVKGVMGLLIGMSVASWFVIGAKSIYLANAANRSTKFQDMFWKMGRPRRHLARHRKVPPFTSRGECFAPVTPSWPSCQRRRPGTGGGARRAGEDLLGDIESIERALTRARTTAITEMESRVPLLGTTASAGPSSASSARCGAS
jgi:biopolymer transport protein TolQ